MALNGSPPLEKLAMGLTPNPTEAASLGRARLALICHNFNVGGGFVANCLPICEATTDSVGLIRNITDWRPSYI
jgi:hypothetical protein